MDRGHGGRQVCVEGWDKVDIGQGVGRREGRRKWKGWDGMGGTLANSPV